MRLRERVDAFPTHRWAARIVFPVVIVQRITQVVPNSAMDTFMLAYLWWLSEVTAQEAWTARREIANERKPQ